MNKPHRLKVIRWGFLEELTCALGLEGHTWGFPGGSDCKESSCNAGDPGSIPGLGKSPGEGNGNPLQFSCLENSWTEEPGGLESMGLQRLGYD